MATFQTLGELGQFLAEQRASSVPVSVVDPGIPLSDYTDRAGGVWDSQPSVRKVVDFIARNVASIPLHAYERVSDTDRPRVTDHPLAALASRPSTAPGMTSFRFWHSIIVDWLTYDRWAAFKITDGSRLELRRVPARRFRFVRDGLEQVTGVKVWSADGTWREYDPDELVFDTGYGATASTPMQAIQHLLEESAEAVAYRRAVWRNGGRVPAVLERDRPWSSDTARDRFVASWRNFTRGGGAEGGTPILEDGMRLVKTEAFTPRDSQDLEGRRLTDIEVASFFHIAPELVGAREGTYSNVDAFRQMLYRDSLGPYITALEQAVNVGVTDEASPSRPIYLEFYLEAKLRGSFIEQAQVISTATGRPWMVTDEARGRMNLPALGGDAAELVTPLNVIIGGQASPRDSGSQNEGGQLARRGTHTKALTVDRQALSNYDERANQVLSSFFARQARVVQTALGVKADDPDWWDGERWDRELTADLFRIAGAVTVQVATATLRSLDIDPDEYDVDRTDAILTAISSRIAGGLNAVTRTQLTDALDTDDPAAAVAHVFDIARGSRAEQAALTAVTTFSGFATTEAVQQVSGNRGTKTWRTTSGNPRSSHAAMNGETVPVGEPFSNGAQFPGDGVLDVDDVAGCQCTLEVDLPA